MADDEEFVVGDLGEVTFQSLRSLPQPGHAPHMALFDSDRVDMHTDALGSDDMPLLIKDTAPLVSPPVAAVAKPVVVNPAEDVARYTSVWFWLLLVLAMLATAALAVMAVFLTLMWITAEDTVDEVENLYDSVIDMNATIPTTDASDLESHIASLNAVVLNLTQLIDVPTGDIHDLLLQINSTLPCEGGGGVGNYDPGIIEYNVTTDRFSFKQDTEELMLSFTVDELVSPSTITMPGVIAYNVTASEFVFKTHGLGEIFRATVSATTLPGHLQLDTASDIAWAHSRIHETSATGLFVKHSAQVQLVTTGASPVSLSIVDGTGVVVDGTLDLASPHLLQMGGLDVLYPDGSNTVLRAPSGSLEFHSSTGPVMRVDALKHVYFSGSIYMTAPNDGQGIRFGAGVCDGGFYHVDGSDPASIINAGPGRNAIYIIDPDELDETLEFQWHANGCNVTDGTPLMSLDQHGNLTLHFGAMNVVGGTHIIGGNWSFVDDGDFEVRLYDDAKFVIHPDGSTTTELNHLIKNDLTVAGTAEVSVLQVTGSATVVGSVGVGVNLTVAGTAIIGRLEIATTATIGTDLLVVGQTSTNSLFVTTNANVSGEVNADTLQVQGSAVVGVDLAVAGDIDLSSTSYVTFGGNTYRVTRSGSAMYVVADSVTHSFTSGEFISGGDVQVGATFQFEWGGTSLAISHSAGGMVFTTAGGSMSLDSSADLRIPSDLVLVAAASLLWVNSLIEENGASTSLRVMNPTQVFLESGTALLRVQSGTGVFLEEATFDVRDSKAIQMNSLDVLSWSSSDTVLKAPSGNLEFHSSAGVVATASTDRNLDLYQSLVIDSTSAGAGVLYGSTGCSGGIYNVNSPRMAKVYSPGTERDMVFVINNEQTNDAAQFEWRSRTCTSEDGSLLMTLDQHGNLTLHVGVFNILGEVHTINENWTILATTEYDIRHAGVTRLAIHMDGDVTVFKDLSLHNGNSIVFDGDSVLTYDGANVTIGGGAPGHVYMPNALGIGQAPQDGIDFHVTGASGVVGIFESADDDAHVRILASADTTPGHHACLHLANKEGIVGDLPETDWYMCLDASNGGYYSPNLVIGSTSGGWGGPSDVYGTPGASDKVTFTTGGKVGIGVVPTALLSVYGGDDESVWDDEWLVRIASKIDTNEWTGLGFGAYSETTVKGGLMWQRMSSYGVGVLHVVIDGVLDTADAGVDDIVATFAPAVVTTQVPLDVNEEFIVRGSADNYNSEQIMMRFMRFGRGPLNTADRHHYITAKTFNSVAVDNYIGFHIDDGSTTTGASHTETLRLAANSLTVTANTQTYLSKADSNLEFRISTGTSEYDAALFVGETIAGTHGIGMWYDGSTNQGCLMGREVTTTNRNVLCWHRDSSQVRFEVEVEFEQGVGFQRGAGSTLYGIIDVQLGDAGIGLDRVVFQGYGSTPQGPEILTKYPSLTIFSGESNAANNPASIGLTTTDINAVSTTEGMLMFGTTRSTSAQISSSSYTAVQSGDPLGSIRWLGDDSTNIRTVGAAITVQSTGAATINDVPAMMTLWAEDRLVINAGRSGDSYSGSILTIEPVPSSTGNNAIIEFNHGRGFMGYFANAAGPAVNAVGIESTKDAILTVAGLTSSVYMGNTYDQAGKVPNYLVVTPDVAYTTNAFGAGTDTPLAPFHAVGASSVGWTSTTGNARTVFVGEGSSGGSVIELLGNPGATSQGAIWFVDGNDGSIDGRLRYEFNNQKFEIWTNGNIVAGFASDGVLTLNEEIDISATSDNLFITGDLGGSIRVFIGDPDGLDGTGIKYDATPGSEIGCMFRRAASATDHELICFPATGIRQIELLGSVTVNRDLNEVPTGVLDIQTGGYSFEKVVIQGPGVGEIDFEAQVSPYLTYRPSLAIFSGDPDVTTNPASIGLITTSVEFAAPAGLYFAATRSTSVQHAYADYTAVVSGDVLGEINWIGDDDDPGVTVGDLRHAAASIYVEVNGAVGTNDVPTKMVFVSNGVETMEIDASGVVMPVGVTSGWSATTTPTLVVGSDLKSGVIRVQGKDTGKFGTIQGTNSNLHIDSSSISYGVYLQWYSKGLTRIGGDIQLSNGYSIKLGTGDAFDGTGVVNTLRSGDAGATITMTASTATFPNVPVGVPWPFPSMAATDASSGNYAGGPGNAGQVRKQYVPRDVTITTIIIAVESEANGNDIAFLITVSGGAAAWTSTTDAFIDYSARTYTGVDVQVDAGEWYEIQFTAGNNLVDCEIYIYGVTR